ncbi:MAG TPA: hypothetical protein VFN61_12675 [Acidimicrobiales bacterium]|nr:hypothetical protein [Acidimicrobiales bacterium]
MMSALILLIGAVPWAQRAAGADIVAQSWELTPSTALGPPPSAANGRLFSATAQADFQPWAFTGLSSSNYWVLGAPACAACAGPELLHTTNGGKTYEGMMGTLPLSTSSGVDVIKFADSRHGYAFSSIAPTPLWTTNDGGAHWAQHGTLAGPYSLLGMTLTANGVLAVAGNCPDTCSAIATMTTPIGSLHWTIRAVPEMKGVNPSSVLMTTWGPRIWLSGQLPDGRPILLRSTDNGHHFRSLSAPCSSVTALDASSPSVIWAGCSDVNNSILRSVDGGSSWQILIKRPGFIPLALSTASSSAAILATDVTGSLIITRDSGKHFRTVYTPHTEGWWMSVGYVSPERALAIRVLGQFPEPYGDHVLMQSNDGGRTWSTAVL